MGQANNVCNKFLLLVIFICLLILCSFPIASNSLIMKLIRRDEIDSNLFPKNLSTIEKHQIYDDLGNSRALRFNEQALCSTSSLNRSVGNLMKDTVSPILSQMPDSMFVVPLTIGSQGYRTYLLFDTGSDFTWLQCKGCRNCFKLQGGPFDQSSSNTYHPLPYDSRLCRRQLRKGPDCGFRMNYVTAKNVEGTVAYENVVFPNIAGAPLTVPNVVLGCATSAPKIMFGSSYGPNNLIAGIFGAAMGTFEDSFMVVTQRITKSKFSYCLPPWSSPRLQTNLRFGDDVQPLPRSVHTTPMTQTSKFYVTLRDIGVAGEPLNLTREWFQVRRGGGGFILDTGTARTYLVGPAYDIVKQAYVRHLGRYMQPVRPVKIFDLCYSWPLPHIPQKPSMAYHFDQANLEVGFWNVFLKVRDEGRDFVCMTLKRGTSSRGTSILGAINQANYRFVHNLEDKTLSFYRDDCTRNS